METFRNKLQHTLTNHIVRLRNKHGYTQNKLAARLGISQSTYCRYEAGAVPISAVHLYEIAWFYQIEITSFFLEGDLRPVHTDLMTDDDLINQMSAYLKSRQMRL